jgi:hypothetical protein
MRPSLAPAVEDREPQAALVLALHPVRHERLYVVKESGTKGSVCLETLFQDYTLTGACELSRRLCCKVRILISSRLINTSFCLPK